MSNTEKEKPTEEDDVEVTADDLARADELAATDPILFALWMAEDTDAMGW